MVLAGQRDVSCSGEADLERRTGNGRGDVALVEVDARLGVEVVAVLVELIGDGIFFERRGVDVERERRVLAPDLLLDAFGDPAFLRGRRRC